MRYDAEVEVIKKNYGSLEEMRLKLGLSRRQICQKLLVDPSAWTRWSATGDGAPAHVYRTLALILDSQIQAPQKLAESVRAEIRAELAAELGAEIKSQVESLKVSLVKSAELSFGYKVLILIALVTSIYVAIR